MLIPATQLHLAELGLHCKDTLDDFTCSHASHDARRRVFRSHGGNTTRVMLTCSSELQVTVNRVARASCRPS